MAHHQTYTVDEILSFVEEWLVTGKLNPDSLSVDFHFSSPFWKEANKTEFLQQFADPAIYQDVSLSKIVRFDPIIQLKSRDENGFAIIVQYHTKNNSHVYEAVYGRLQDGQLVELRSIYDLAETKHALELTK